MSDPTYPLFPIFAFLGFLVTIIPLPWHLEAMNSATCYFMLWSSIACLNQFVNSVVWHGSVLNVAPVWCDISTRIMIGATTVSLTQAEKRRAVLIDSLLCVVLPIVCMALAYVVQGHRFDIYEDIGCYPVIIDTLAAYFLVFMWPLLLGIVSIVYCTLSIRAFARRRAGFKEFLTNNTAFTVSRYFRLMGIAMTEICCTTPLAIVVIILNATDAPMDPWKGWDDAHFDFSRVDQVPAVFWKMNPITHASVELSRWLVPLSAFLFFALFGFAEEARKQYRKAFQMVVVLLGIGRRSRDPASSPSHKQFHLSSNGSDGTLPVYGIRPPPQSKVETVDLYRSPTSEKHRLDSYPSTPTFVVSPFSDTSSLPVETLSVGNASSDCHPSPPSSPHL
ncbi:STE3-domain-containing protein [Artomyces pyxidatus]|uniref:STE3-domain-containing protein n=1 Tax=Artomyces pyxidatus TaxID=48021 RepID=A0ACB8SM03_9AGAM|nr:STE3-domain-containing protein [Artomyces pyxidatus]